MARNRIEELLVELKFKGGEELKKISGGFRELAKAANLADADIEDARAKIIDYGKSLGNTNQAVKGTIQALKALQESTQRGGEAWTQLSRDVLQFEQAARLTDREIESLRRGIVAEASAHSQSETSIRAHVRALQELRAQSVLGGQVNRQLSQTIGQLTQQLDQAEQASRAHFSALNQMLAVRPDAVLRQYQAYTQVLRDVRATAEQAAEAQQRLNQLAGAPRIAARRELVARAGIQADPAYQERFGLGGRSLEALPDVPAALSLRLRELQEDLSLTTRNTGLYIRTLVEMAAVQRQASATTQGFAAALREQLASGELPRTQKNLQEVIGALRREMIELDTSTATGSRAYAENAAQVRVLERELNQLANSYRNVADMAVQAATAERSAATARVTALYMNNRAVRDQAQAMSELGNAVRSGIAGTPLMLPAAGQTSAPGTGLQVSGGARIGGPSGNIQRVLTPGTFPGERQQGPEVPFEISDRQRRAYLSTAEAARVKAEAEDAAKEATRRLRGEVDKAAQANNGSINSIQRYRDSLVTLRNTLPATGNEFKKLSSQVERLDAQLERAQRRRRRMSATEATQAAGAVISGGIFGGPEGAIGGAIGTAVGGVPGAFAGAAIGAQVGMVRQSLGQMAAFTAEIDKQRIALRNVVGSQAEYEKSLQFIDATSRRLAIPQDQLNKQFTQLSASVIGAGGNVDAAKLAFEGIAAGIRGTGGNLNDMEAALRATAQVFSKGKVSAEELRQQIGERLPGAFTLFAQSIGKTPQELDKLLESGEVDLNDFMKFVQALSTRYGSSANEIAASSQAAGDRIQVTFARLREAVGRELQPVGAGFQDTFARLFEEAEPGLVSVASGISTVLTALGSAANAFIEFTKPIRDFIGTYPAIFSAFWESIGQDVTDLFDTIGSFLNGVSSFWLGVWNGLRDATSAAFRAIGIDTDWLGEQFQRFISWLEGAWDDAFVFISSRWKETVRNMINNSNPITFILKNAGIDVGEAVTKGMAAGSSGGRRRGRTSRRPRQTTDFDLFPGGGGEGGDGKEKKKEKVELSRVPQLLLEQRLQDEIGKIQDKIREAQLSENNLLEIRLQGEQQLLRIRNQMELVQLEDLSLQEKALRLGALRGERDEALKQIQFNLNKAFDENIKKATAGLDDLTAGYNDQILKQERINELLAGGMNPELAEQVLLIERAAEKETELLTIELGRLEALKAQGSKLIDILKLEEDIARIRGLLAGIGTRKTTAIEGATQVTQEPTDAERVRAAIKQTKEELDKLKDPVNQLIGAATAIGDAFSNSFKGVITGSMTAKEALAGFFSSVAEYFADMAAKMIAQWIKLAILNTIVRIFNPTAGGGFSPLGNAEATSFNFDPGAMTGSLTPGGLFAKGGTFAQNGIVPYAKGGIVNSPTLFKFARGSAMATGVMGEAGPEAIMPLKRGADGKLGVAGGGGTGTTVNVSVDAKGTQVQGDSAQGAALGRVIAGAVQAELIKQQRPGGLLSGGR